MINTADTAMTAIQKKPITHDGGQWSFSCGVKVSHLSLHLPTGNGGFAVIARFELQGDGAGADVGNCHVGRGARKLCEEAEREEPTSVRERERERERKRERKREREWLREQTTDTTVGLSCVAASHTGWFIYLSAPWWPHRYGTRTHFLRPHYFLSQLQRQQKNSERGLDCL